MSSSAGPVQGPCVAWIDGEDVAACTPEGVSSDSSIYDDFAIEASMLLFELSGRQYTGGCEQTVRPCQTRSCGGTASIAQGVSPIWWWGNWPVGGNQWGWYTAGEGGGALCGCTAVSRVKLSGYPVTEIVEVMIGDEVIPEVDDDGDLNWRLDNWRWLTRMWKPNADDPANPTPRMWPACQNLALDDGQPGTFTVTYRFGVVPPLAGVKAAAELAYQLFLACSGGDCALPEGVVKLVRNGVTIDRALFLSWGRTTGQRGHGDLAWSTGLTLVDAFLNAYNPARQRRRSVVWSPDVQQFARKMGT